MVVRGVKRLCLQKNWDITLLNQSFFVVDKRTTVLESMYGHLAEKYPLDPVATGSATILRTSTTREHGESGKTMSEIPSRRRKQIPPST